MVAEIPLGSPKSGAIEDRIKDAYLSQIDPERLISSRPDVAHLNPHPNFGALYTVESVLNYQPKDHSVLLVIGQIRVN